MLALEAHARTQYASKDAEEVVNDVRDVNYGLARLEALLRETHGALIRQVRGWRHEVTGFERNRLYRYPLYLDLFDRATAETSFLQASGSLAAV
ncbi:MAG: hypothetical protein M9919_10895 [Burkholderiaceae bacterium]|nr:hypothetical protein [Burkholderiaceae bacterium]